MTEIGEAVNAPIPGADPSQPPPEDEEDKDKEPKSIKVRLSLFFDGTANNKTNTEHRLQGTATYQQHRDEGSYANDYSNVARLWQYAKEEAAGYDYHKKQYIEGIGTTDSGADTGQGLALGEGETGVTAKVEKGISLALGWLSDVAEGDTVIEELKVDTFGFSRGAAAARYCVYRALYNIVFGPPRPLLGFKDGAARRGIKVEKVVVHAVGLFETVSSLGIVHDDDVKGLQLDSIREAEQVLQLAAAEEYRKNFALTTIDSAGRKGAQIYLPGAHSDVGGGYVDGEGEERMFSHDIGQLLLQRGWYHDRQVIPTRSRARSLTVHRAGISNRYSYLPLGLMADFAAEQGLTVKKELYEDFDPGGVPAAGRIKAYASSKPAGSKPGDWEGDEPDLKALRRGYLHMSSSTSVGMGMRTVNEQGEPKPRRQIIRG